MSATNRVVAAQVTLVSSLLAGVALLVVAMARVTPTYGLLVGLLAAAATLWWCRGVFSRRRVVLWLEERVPSLRYSLAALTDAPETPFRAHLEARVRQARFANVLSLATLKLVGIPLVLLAVSQFIVRPLVASMTSDARAATGIEGPTPDAGRSGALRFTATVTPPVYSRERAHTVENPASITALVGSGIRFAGAFASQTSMPATPTIHRLGAGDAQRMVALEPRPDSAPRVVLEMPARDTVMAAARGAMRLRGVARDDIGITAGWFEIIGSIGELPKAGSKVLK